MVMRRLLLSVLILCGCHSTARRPDGPPAHRIVSLLPSFTEILFAIGAGDRVVGRTQWCDYPPAALAVPSVGEALPPNVEAVAARRPDLVVLYNAGPHRSEEHTSELQSRVDLVCRLLLEKKK